MARVKTLFFDIAFADEAPRWKTHDQIERLDRVQRQRFQQWHRRGVGKCTSYLLPRTHSDCFERGLVCQQDDVSTFSNGVAPCCGTILRSRSWYLHGRIENVYSEADEVISQVRSRTLAAPSAGAALCCPTDKFFIFIYASLIMPTRGG